MGKLKNIPGLAICILLWATSGYSQNAFETGSEELYRGNTERALEIWKNSYDESSRVDSRIGLEYIRTVAAQHLKEFYEDATNMYYRALNDGDGPRSHAAVRMEIDRLKPLAGDGVFRQWETWWHNKDPELGIDIKGLWIQLDPTPSTLKNERLIEHWQRIEESRKRFTRNANTVYGTDDRALIYIRYGQPDRVKNGILTLQSYNIKPWLENQVSPREDNFRPQRVSDERPPEQSVVKQLEDAVYEFHRYPEYEIWFYDDLTENSSEPVIFFFGTDWNTNEFLAQRSLTDFVPERAFYPDQVRDGEPLEFIRTGITPALMLMMLYYEQLTTFDPYFSERLKELREAVLEQGIDALKGMDLQFKSTTTEIVNQKVSKSPRQRSVAEDRMPKIPIQFYHYRFLNEDNEPVLLSFLESYPQEALLIDYFQNRSQNIVRIEQLPGPEKDRILERYELVHSLHTYLENWDSDLARTDRPDLVLNRDNGRKASESVFLIPHKSQQHAAASVEFLNVNNIPEAGLGTALFPSGLIGLNSVKMRLPEPLQNEPDSLEMADLVLGYESEEITPPFTFKVANDQWIPRDRTLFLHFEVYHLEMPSNGFSQFELTYRIFPIDKDGEVITDQDDFILTINFTNETSRVVEDLEIETADLTPGLYELHLQIEDVYTGQTKSQIIRFEVE